MQLLGSAGVLPSIPGVELFSEESLLIGGGDHYVFKMDSPPKMVPGGRSYHDTGDGVFLSLRSSPRWKGVVTSRTPHSASQVFYGEPVNDPDPMVGFFLGAESLQRSMRFQPSYQGKSLFTIVYQPIMAIPLPDKGYRLRCEISQFYADKGDIINISDATSSIGQIPTEAPSDVDLKLMNMVASEVYKYGGVRREDVPGIIRNIRNRRIV